MLEEETRQVCEVLNAASMLWEQTVMRERERRAAVNRPAAFSFFVLVIEASSG